ncbi:MAG: sigma factor [Caulobacteraceae bacterium]
MLTGERDSAEDLAQEALAKALQFQQAFRPGTNLRAWLFTIARNEFYTKRRRAWRAAPYDEAAAERIASDAAQHWSVELSDTMRALQQLPQALREVLLLVGRRRLFVRGGRRDLRLRGRHRKEPCLAGSTLSGGDPRWRAFGRRYEIRPRAHSRRMHQRALS